MDPEPPTTEVPEPVVIPQASHIEKLPPRPAPTQAYSWDEWSSNARVFYLRNTQDANKLLVNLKPGPVGFDLEWKPVFYKGARENRVALVQIANDDVIFLLQISAMKEFPAKLREVLENPAIIKAGVGIQGDSQKLYKDWLVSIRSCVDLSLLARTVDNARWKGKYNMPIGLARLVEVYYYRLLEKGKITRSNWEKLLDTAQQTYASNDAHSGYALYTRLMEMVDPVNPPDIKYYTFDCIMGLLRQRSGLLWRPENPMYDPGPPPPPKPPRVRNGVEGETESLDQDTDSMTVTPASMDLEPQQPSALPVTALLSEQRRAFIANIERTTQIRQQNLVSPGFIPHLAPTVPVYSASVQHSRTHSLHSYTHPRVQIPLQVGTPHHPHNPPSQDRNFSTNVPQRSPQRRTRKLSGHDDASHGPSNSIGNAGSGQTQQWAKRRRGNRRSRGPHQPNAQPAASSSHGHPPSGQS